MNRFFTTLRLSEKRRFLLGALIAVVVFVTVYLLILPAVTMDRDTAERQGGVDVPATEEVTETAPAGETAQGQEEEGPAAGGDGEIAFDGEGYKVKAAFGERAELPADTGLAVSEIGTDDPDYEAWHDEALKAVQESKGGEQTEDLAFAKFYDITLTSGSGEIEPSAPVDVTISYDKPIKAKDVDHVRVIHFTSDSKGRVEAEVLKASDVDVTEAKGKMTETSFKAESFSMYAVVYTVDFEYEGHEYRLPGSGSMLLSNLLSELNVDVEMSEIEDVEFSDPDLISVEKADKAAVKKLYSRADRMLEVNKDSGLSKEELSKDIYEYLGIPQNEDISSDDWILTSIRSFDTEESLTISTNDGKTYVIKVTDPATQDVSGLLTDVSINATKNSDGSYTVYAGQAYGIDLSFKEQPSGIQFDMTNGFYYPIPAGLLDTDTLTGKALIELSGGDHAGETVELDYHLEGGNLVFTWPDQTSGAYQQLKDAIYTHVKIHIEAKFDEKVTEIPFNEDITKKVDVKTDGKADVTKNGTYNPATNSIDYTVTVKSSGICKDVVVSDTISGSALTYNNDAKATSNRNNTSYTPVPSGNGFTFTIPQMGDGEEVTVRYSAAVDLDALTRDENGNIGTVEQTGNKVKVTPSNHPGDEDEKSGKDLNNKISYSTIKKTSSVGETGEDGHATVKWTIKANEFANVSMAGHTISDSIDAGSRSIMKYSGTGINVVRKDKNGVVVSTETIPWGNLTSHSDSAWTWTVPNQGTDSGKLSYEITYTTDVDANGQLFNTQVKNTGTSDNGGSSTGTGTVEPPGGALTARKTFISKDLTGEEKTVTWEVNFDVPATGLDSAEIDDTLPSYWSGSSAIMDSYKEGTITITPELAFGESYEESTYTDSNGIDHLKITFYKTVNEHKVTGLSGTGSKRKIRVQFKTVLNEDWLEAAKTNAGAVSHENKANVILNGQALGTQASVNINVTEPEISKSHDSETINVVNGNTLPAWKFYITLSGVSDDTFDENGQIVIEDTYNSKYLDWHPHAYADWDKENGQVFGGDSGYNRRASSADKVMTKVADGQLKIVLNQADLPRTENGDYYPLYTVPYYLTVKDPISYQKLIAAATNTQGGSIALYNTASNEIFGEVEDKVDYEVPVVNKKATEPTLQNGIYKLHYTIEVNEKALQLGDSDELVMTDEYSNISIDYTTVQIYEYINNVKTLVNDVIWDRSGYTSTYYLKNATHYVIEYDAHLSGEGEKIDENRSRLTYTNTAEAFGKKSTWEKTKVIEDSSSGGSRTFRIKVLKHVKGNASQGLPGAVFELWKYTPTQDDPEGKDNRPDKDAPGWENTGKTLTTDSKGYAQTTNDMQIHSQTWYKLVETQAPAGYTLKTTHYFFWITEGQVADYSKYVYVNDDVLAINNTPELPKTVDVSVEKVWDDNSDLSLRRDVKVHLYADGQPYNEYFSGEWAANAREDADVTLHLRGDGSSETYTWKGLPSGYTYSVVEDPVPGYVTTYSPKNTLTDGTLKITNKRNTYKTAISVDKEWTDGAKPAEDVTIQLKRNILANAPIAVQNGANKVGAEGAHITDYSVPAGATVKLEWKYKNSWGYDSPALNIYNYGTKDLIKHLDKISGSPTQHSMEVEVPPEGIIVAFEEPYLSSLNDFTGAFDFDVHVVSTGSGESSEDVNFTNERHYYTLKPDQNWHLDIDNLVLSDDDGAYTYYIEEVGVNDNTQTPQEAGYEVSYTNNGGITKGTIKAINKKEPPAKIRVTKAFSGIGALPDGFRIVNNYNNDIFTVANATGEGTASNPYIWEIEDIPEGTEVEFTETGASADGHTLTITANGVAQPEGSATASASAAAAKVAAGGAVPSVSFINTYERNKEPGSLQLTKRVTEEGADSNKSFGFTIDLTAPTGETLADSYVFKKGTATASGITYTRGADGSGASVTGINLKAGETFTIEDLPAGTEYSITEDDYSQDGYSPETTAGNLTGTIVSGAATQNAVEVTNTHSTGTLTVEKTATGSGAEPSKKFKFRVTIVRQNRASGVHGQYTIGGTTYPVNFSHGTATVEFDLTSGQKAVFEKIQKNATFTVVELSADKDGYSTSVTSTGGTVSEKTVTGTFSNQVAITAAYVNHRDSINVNILKVDDDNTSIKLGGATFRLTKVTAIDSINQVAQDTYDQTGTTSEEAAKKGELQFTGLTPGFYYLQETNAPTGYVTDNKGWHFQVNQDGIVSGAGDFDPNGTIRYIDAHNVMVTNIQGAQLPSTGGSGTTWIYLLGLSLFLGCGIGLIVRRRIRIQ